MTAVGLLMRLYLGWNRDDPLHAARAPSICWTTCRRWHRDNEPQRDTYYWYYATQVMFHMKGDYWTAWNERLHPLLIDTQVQTRSAGRQLGPAFRAGLGHGRRGGFM